MFDKIVERAAKPTSLRRCDSIAFFVVSDTTGYYLNIDRDMIDSFRFSIIEFDQWIQGNNRWERVTSFYCGDPDLAVAEGL